MCGRYALAGDWSEFTREFNLSEVPGLTARYNIAPTFAKGYEVPYFRKTGVLSMGRFWFIPSWWERPLSELPTTFNARSESVTDRPFFRNAQACLIPTTGWREFPGTRGTKRSFQFEMGQGSPLFTFAGIASTRHDNKEGEELESFAILTGNPHSLVRPVHHRMPLIVPPDGRKEWLESDQNFPDLLPQIQSCSLSANLRSYECSSFGNSTKVEGPECLAPLAQQGLLF